MGDLKSKLRAKFSRRHSGIPSYAASKNSSKTRGTSECLTNDHGEPSFPKCGDSVAGSHGAETLGNGRELVGTGGTGSRSGPLRAKKSTTAGEASDRLRPAEESKQETGDGARCSTDVRVASIQDLTDTDTANGDNRLPQAAATRNCYNIGLPKNATDTGHFTMRSAETLSAHAQSAATASGGPGHGVDKRALMVKLSRLHEQPSSNHVDAAINDQSSTPTTATVEPPHRLNLSDVPLPAPPTPAVANADANHVAAHDNPLSIRPPSPTPTSTSTTTVRPSDSVRRQSSLAHRQATLLRALLKTTRPDDIDSPNAEHLLLPVAGKMVMRKIWVRRPGASPTLVTIGEDDLVDDVRDTILRKYSNSLGRHFDSPDLYLRIVPREPQRQERLLGPDEHMARTLDAYYPGGQKVDEALIIDVPTRRTPRASPRTGPPHAQHLTSAHAEDGRPTEAATDYFGPEAVANSPSSASATGPNGANLTHSISVINTGQVPQIPSPGGTRTRAYRDRPDRPRLGRQHTSSPTIINVVSASGQPATIAVASGHGTQQSSPKLPRPRTHSNASSDQLPAVDPPTAPPLPTPPAPEATPTPVQTQRTATPPPPRTASPHPPLTTRPKKPKPTVVEHPTLSPSVRIGVPPISVLIVEDNIINLRLLEAFIKRLKVRWEVALNGREAVNKWREGGYHLVLMDIQLPVMSGLEATREIRRLERMNSIGAFSSPPSARKDGGAGGDTDPDDDRLENRHLFKSPVIIVALTASSLQSDRHQALAAGCNDFLTKPVTYLWLERKVMEWGCMQALIDYDGWRKWKSYSGDGDSDSKAPTKKLNAKGTKPLQSAGSPEPPTS